MMATAHPDDENNALLVALNRGQGIRTALATATRGNGGQNEIGPELFEPLGVLRTAELAAMHRFDGAEQYFTRAVDFGYTIDIPETLAKWGRDEIIGDYVRLIRTVRPDVISAQSPTATGPGQHAHHATAAILSHDAYKLAGDPTKYPEQLREGLRAWQPRKFYNAAGAGAFGFAEAGAANTVSAVPARACRVTLDVYDALLGRTYAEIGTEARSMHKCQGQAQLLALPGSSTSAFQLTETTIPGQMDRDERSLFDGVDTTIASLSQFAGARAPRELTDGLAAIASAVQLAQKQFDASRRRVDAHAPARRTSRRRSARRPARHPRDRRGSEVRNPVPSPSEGTGVPAGDFPRQRRPRRCPRRRRCGRAWSAGAGQHARVESRRR
jgi:LmbE family N-acetylglucosaminyl deacetylase